MLSADSTLLHRVAHNCLNIDYCQLDAHLLYPHVFKAEMLSTQPQILCFEIWLITCERRVSYGAIRCILTFPEYLLCMNISRALPFLGAFAKLRKATVSFVMSVRQSVCPSICPHWINRLLLDGFSWNLIFEYFSNNLSRKFECH